MPEYAKKITEDGISIISNFLDDLPCGAMVPLLESLKRDGIWDMQIAKKDPMGFQSMSPLELETGAKLFEFYTSLYLDRQNCKIDKILKMPPFSACSRISPRRLLSCVNKFFL